MFLLLKYPFILGVEFSSKLHKIFGFEALCDGQELTVMWL